MLKTKTFPRKPLVGRARDVFLARGSLNCSKEHRDLAFFGSKWSVTVRWQESLDMAEKNLTSKFEVLLLQVGWYQKGGTPS